MTTLVHQRHMQYVAVVSPQSNQKYNFQSFHVMDHLTTECKATTITCSSASLRTCGSVCVFRQATELAELTSKISLLEDAKKKKEEEATEWQKKVNMITCHS